MKLNIYSLRKLKMSVILGMINVTSHDGNNLWDVEGQVLVDSKELQITKEDDEGVSHQRAHPDEFKERTSQPSSSQNFSIQRSQKWLLKELSSLSF